MFPPNGIKFDAVIKNLPSPHRSECSYLNFMCISEDGKRNEIIEFKKIDCDGMKYWVSRRKLYTGSGFDLEDDYFCAFKEGDIVLYKDENPIFFNSKLNYEEIEYERQIEKYTLFKVVQVIYENKRYYCKLMGIIDDGCRPVTHQSLIRIASKNENKTNLLKQTYETVLRFIKRRS